VGVKRTNLSASRITKKRVVGGGGGPIGDRTLKAPPGLPSNRGQFNGEGFKKAIRREEKRNWLTVGHYAKTLQKKRIMEDRACLSRKGDTELAFWGGEG